MRPMMHPVPREASSRGKFVHRARAAFRRLRPIAYAYLADRAYGS
ncbi:hypothetical protein [Burkholderia guangdongensis]|nr:hypothetical protein [Burkholderia guangdongensis]